MTQTEIERMQNNARIARLARGPGARRPPKDYGRSWRGALLLGYVPPQDFEKCTRRIRYKRLSEIHSEMCM